MCPSISLRGRQRASSARTVRERRPCFAASPDVSLRVLETFASTGWCPGMPFHARVSATLRVKRRCREAYAPLSGVVSARPTTSHGRTGRASNALARDTAASGPAHRSGEASARPHRPRRAVGRLDPDAGRWLSTMLETKRDRGAAVVLSSHRLHDLAGLC